MVCALLLVTAPAHAQTPELIAPAGAAPPTMAQPPPPPVKANKSPHRFAAAISLARLLAPMLQLKVEHTLGDKLVVGALVARGSPARVGLTEYTQTEFGPFAGYYALGSSRKGLGVVVQARGYISSGKQDGEDGADPFEANGSAFSAAALLSVRRVFASSLLLQADYGLTYLISSGEATADGETTEANTKQGGTVLNVWVGLTF